MGTKKTLVVSAIIMALTLVVTIVGVSAAWFGDTLKVSNDIVIQSNVPQTDATINIDSALNRTNTKLVPTIMKKNWLLTSTSTKNNQTWLTQHVLDDDFVDPLGDAGTNDELPFVSLGTTVYIYFQFTVPKDTSSSMSKDVVVISVDSANTPNSGVDVLSEFKLSMELCQNVVETETIDPQTSLPDYSYTYTPITSTTTISATENPATPNACYWTFVEEENKFYGFVNALTENPYWIRFGISYGKVNEELNSNLMNTLVKFNVSINADAETRYTLVKQHLIDIGKVVD